MGNQPEQKYQAGSVQAAIWKKEIKKDKQTFVVYNVSLQRSYKDKDDEWKNQTIHLNNVTEIQKVELVLAKAKEYLLMSKDEKDGNDDGGVSKKEA